jgi:hypothetical protein
MANERVYKVLVPIHGGGHEAVEVLKLSGPMVQNRIIPAGSIIKFTGEYDESNLIDRGVIEATTAAAAKTEKPKGGNGNGKAAKDAEADDDDETDEDTDDAGEGEGETVTAPKHANPIPTGEKPAKVQKKQPLPKHANQIPTA